MSVVPLCGSPVLNNGGSASACTVPCRGQAALHHPSRSAPNPEQPPTMVTKTYIAERGKEIKEPAKFAAFKEAFCAVLHVQGYLTSKKTQTSRTLP